MNYEEVINLAIEKIKKEKGIVNSNCNFQREISPEDTYLYYYYTSRVFNVSAIEYNQKSFYSYRLTLQVEKGNYLSGKVIGCVYCEKINGRWHKIEIIPYDFSKSCERIYSSLYLHTDLKSDLIDGIDYHYLPYFIYEVIDNQDWTIFFKKLISKSENLETSVSYFTLKKAYDKIKKAYSLEKAKENFKGISLSSKDINLIANKSPKTFLIINDFFKNTNMSEEIKNYAMKIFEYKGHEIKIKTAFKSGMTKIETTDVIRYIIDNNLPIIKWDQDQDQNQNQYQYRHWYWTLLDSKIADFYALHCFFNEVPKKNPQTEQEITTINDSLIEKLKKLEKGKNDKKLLKYIDKQIDYPLIVGNIAFYVPRSIVEAEKILKKNGLSAQTKDIIKTSLESGSSLVIAKDNITNNVKGAILYHRKRNNLKIIPMSMYKICSYGLIKDDFDKTLEIWKHAYKIYSRNNYIYT